MNSCTCVLCNVTVDHENRHDAGCSPRLLVNETKRAALDSPPHKRPVLYLHRALFGLAFRLLVYLQMNLSLQKAQQRPDLIEGKQEMTLTD